MSSSLNSEVCELEDPRLSIAIDNFRSEIAALFKKSMISAGYKPSETDECDQAYMTFVEKALREESSRIQRMRNAMYKNSAVGYLDESNHEPVKAEDGSTHQHEHGICNHVATKVERKCLHSRHFHRLEGKCGHKAIVHKPPGGNPHIDFVVNDKVECYEGCNPMMDYSAFWPSSFSVEEGAALAPISTEEHKELLNMDHHHNEPQQHRTEQILYEDQQRQQLQCLGDDCKPPPNDPKIFDLKDLDMTCGEWSQIFSEDESSKSDEAALGTLFSLQKHSEV